MWSADPALTPWLNRPLCILHGQKFIFFCGKNASGKPATLNQCKTQEWLFKEGATRLFSSTRRLNLLLQSSWGQSKMHSDGKFTVYLILWHGSKSEREKKNGVKTPRFQNFVTRSCWMCSEMTRQDEPSGYQSSVSVSVDLSGFYQPVKASYNQTLPNPVRNKWKTAFSTERKKVPFLQRTCYPVLIKVPTLQHLG